MNAATLSIPRAPRLPSDWIALLTYTPRATATQKRRQAESAMRAAGVSTNGATQADDLA